MITKPKPGFLINPLHPFSRGLIGWWLFNEGGGPTAFDYSGRGNHGLILNASLANIWSGSHLGGTILFDGTAEVNMLDPAILDFGLGQVFSVSFWLRSNTSSGDRMAIDKRGTAATGYQFRYTDVAASWFLRIDDGAVIQDTTVNTNLDDGKPHHIIFGRDLNQHFIYVDGVLDNTTADSTLANLSNINFFRVGKSNDSPFGHIGTIDDVRVFDRNLAYTEIQQLFTNPYANVIPTFSSASSIIASAMNGISGIGSILRRRRR